MPVTRITDRVRAEHCVPRLQGETREEVIQELAARFVATRSISAGECDMLLESVLEREEQATTGIGHGVALPHPKGTEDVADFLDALLIGVGLHATGVEFASLDGEPVHIVFLVASPDKHEYLEVARRIAVLARGGSGPLRWRRILLQARTPEAIREALVEAWEELA